MNQKITKALLWTTTNAAEFYFIYLWLFNDIQWARNLIVFWLIFNLVSMFIVTSSAESVMKLRKKGRSVPKELAYLCYVLGVALLAAQGEFLFAAILVLSSLLEIGIFDGDSLPEE